MPNPAFEWSPTDLADAIKSGISPIILYDKCLDVVDFVDGTELTTALGANDAYKICPTMAELPEGETQNISVNTNRGTIEKPSRRTFTLNFEGFFTTTHLDNAKLIDGSDNWRVGFANADESGTRIYSVFDKQIDSMALTVDFTGNSQDNIYMIKGTINWSMPISPGATNTSNGEHYDITSNSGMITALACDDGDCA